MSRIAPILLPCPIKSVPGRKTKRNSGYSVVELLVAGTILALGIIAITSMIQVSTSLDGNTSLKQQAVIRLRSALEHDYFYPSDVAGWNGAPPTFPGCSLAASTSGGAPIPCTISVAVSNTPVGGEAYTGRSVEYRTFLVSISWQAPGEAQETIAVTLYAPRPNIP